MPLVPGIIVLSLFGLLASLSFSGIVPPHRANDGLIYRVSASSGVDVAGTLRTCGINDVAMLPGAGLQFAVAASMQSSVTCVGAHLPADARLVRQDRWAD